MFWWSVGVDYLDVERPLYYGTCSLVTRLRSLAVVAVMVKNHGFLPAGPRELTRQRQEFTNILFSTWDACTHPTPNSNRPFLADCIIANPPSAGES